MRSILSFTLTILLALCLAAPNASARSDKKCQAFGTQINPTEAGATFDYIDIWERNVTAVFNDADDFVTPVETVIWGLWAEVNVAPGAGDIWLIEVYTGPSSIPLTCSISGTATECYDGSEATLPRGTDFLISVDSSTGATDPDAAANLKVGFCMDYKGY